MTLTKQIVLLLTALIMSVGTATAQDTPNARQARRVFDDAYTMIYGPEGASFHYRISILSIYSSEGSGWYKGNKSKSTTRKSIIWDNGDIKYILRKGKGIVEIHDPKVNKKDKLLQKFKFNRDDFNYSIAKEDNDMIVTLKAKPGTKTNMSEIQAYLEPVTHKPRRLRIKVSFFWANIYFTDFQAGGIDDSLFIFPREQYPDYKIVDER
jgi:hypothetical protein